MVFELPNLTDNQWRAEYERILRHDPCGFCGVVNPRAGKKQKGKRPLVTVDHIIPKSAGGENSWENLGAACEQCNEAKGRLSLLEFLLVILGG